MSCIEISSIPGQKPMKITASLAIAATIFVMASPASAQFAKPEKAVEYRQSAMFSVGEHFSRLGAMVNGRVPFDAKAAIENAEIVAMISKLPAPAFGPDTEKITSRAKPEVWTQQAKFNEGYKQLVSDAEKMVAAAKTNDPDKLKVAF